MDTQFVLTRAKATIDAATILKDDWVWKEKSIAQLKASHQALKDQQDLTGVKHTDMISARHDLDAELDEYHLKTVAVLRLARTRFRNDPAKRNKIQRLTANGDSRTATLAEGKAIEDQWREMDPAWVPLEELTLETFTQYRTDCRDLQDSYTTEHSLWRSEADKTEALAEQLHDELVAWYSDATTVFASDTAHGAMIRGTVPTTYQPAGLPGPTVLSQALSNQAGVVHLSYSAANATRYTVLHKGPGDADFAAVQTSEATDFDAVNVPAGQHQYKVFAANSRGNGPESDVAVVAVGAQAVA